MYTSRDPRTHHEIYFKLIRDFSCGAELVVAH